MARFIDESFEGTGYEETWSETVESGCTVDEDSTGPGSLPSGGGSQCLQIVSGGNAGYALRDSGANRSTSYTRLYLYISSLSMASGEDVNVCQARAESGTNTIALLLYHNGTAVVWRLNWHDAGTWNSLTGTSAVTEDQWLRVEWAKTAAGALELRVDGTTVVSTTGISLDRGEPRSWMIGAQCNGSPSITAYFDLVAVDDTTWVGAEGGVNTDITAGAGALTATGPIPVLDLGITPGAGSITITGAAPTDIERGLRYSYPTADTTAGPWAASSGSDLYAMIDEETPSDTDYIYANATGTGKFKILPVTDPGASTGHVVNYRIWSPVAGNAKVRLVQGTTTVAEWTHTGLPTTAALYSQSLTGEQADAITDYDDLYLEFEAT